MFWIVLIIAALFFSWRNYKKNKPLIAVRIAEEKEKDRLKDLRAIPDGGNGRWR